MTYRSWNSAPSARRRANQEGGATWVTFWNASRSAPDLATEPQRVSTEWKPADVVILSCSHRKTAGEIDPALKELRKAVLRNPDANIIVMIQE